MFDRYLMPLMNRVLAGPARALHRRGVHADSVTLAGFALALLTVPALAAGLSGVALALIVANRILDGLDGAVARIAGTTDRGAFADIAFDFLFYALVPLGFALGDPTANALPAAVLIASFVGTGSSFLAFAAIAAKRALTADDYPRKGIYYLGGLTEGTETIAVFILMCLFPEWFPALAYAYAAMCAVTAALRWRQGWVTFSQSPTE